MYPTLFSNTHMVSKPSIYSSTNSFFGRKYITNNAYYQNIT